jgi:hypothetical protein
MKKAVSMTNFGGTNAFEILLAAENSLLSIEAQSVEV